MPTHGELNAGGEALRHVVHEHQGALAVPAADEMRHNELRIGVERCPRPCVSSPVRRGLRLGYVLRSGVGEAPDLVALGALRLQVPQRLAWLEILDAATCLADLRGLGPADGRVKPLEVPTEPRLSDEAKGRVREEVLKDLKQALTNQQNLTWI